LKAEEKNEEQVNQDIEFERLQEKYMKLRNKYTEFKSKNVIF